MTMRIPWNFRKKNAKREQIGESFTWIKIGYEECYSRLYVLNTHLCIPINHPIFFITSEK